MLATMLWAARGKLVCSLPPAGGLWEAEEPCRPAQDAKRTHGLGLAGLSCPSRHAHVSEETGVNPRSTETVWKVSAAQGTLVSWWIRGGVRLRNAVLGD